MNGWLIDTSCPRVSRYRFIHERERGSKRKSGKARVKGKAPNSCCIFGKREKKKDRKEESSPAGAESRFPPPFCSLASENRFASLGTVHSISHFPFPIP